MSISPPRSTLIYGHAAQGTQIPLWAVERIEAMGDGPSARFLSNAVRSAYHGAQRHGVDADDRRVAQKHLRTVWEEFIVLPLLRSRNEQQRDLATHLGTYPSASRATDMLARCLPLTGRYAEDTPAYKHLGAAVSYLEAAAAIEAAILPHAPGKKSRLREESRARATILSGHLGEAQEALVEAYHAARSKIRIEPEHRNAIEMASDSFQQKRASIERQAVEAPPAAPARTPRPLRPVANPLPLPAGILRAGLGRRPPRPPAETEAPKPAFPRVARASAPVPEEVPNPDAVPVPPPPSVWNRHVKPALLPVLKADHGLEHELTKIVVDGDAARFQVVLGREGVQVRTEVAFAGGSDKPEVSYGIGLDGAFRPATLEDVNETLHDGRDDSPAVRLASEILVSDMGADLDFALGVTGRRNVRVSPMGDGGGANAERFAGVLARIEDIAGERGVNVEVGVDGVAVQVGPLLRRGYEWLGHKGETVMVRKSSPDNVLAFGR